MQIRKAAGAVGVVGLWLLMAGRVWAAPAGAAVNSAGLSPLVILTYLLPLGLLLLTVATWDPKRAQAAAVGAIVAWGLAMLAYFAVGFAFQFGGVAIASDATGLAGLKWEYSLLDASWGTGWGMIGFSGFLLAGPASTPMAQGLFLAQLPFLGVAAMVAHFALRGRTPGWLAALSSLLMGGLIYPLMGNWVWGGGWLANLGYSLGMGHGLVDAAGATAVLAGAAVALAALLVLPPPQPAGSETQTPQYRSGVGSFSSLPTDTLPIEPLGVPMPTAYMPLLGWLGAMLLLMGGAATAALSHSVASGSLPAVIVAVNLVLAGLGGALAASLYGWFTTGESDLLMSARGLLAGMVVLLAGAPFVPAWVALLAGLVMGLLVPLLVFVVDMRWQLVDRGGAVAVLGVPAVLGLLLVGLAADGGGGSDWNRLVNLPPPAQAATGVAGLFARGGVGQLQAQVVGLLVVGVWSFGLAWLLLKSIGALIGVWERSGLEFGTPPPVVDLSLEDSPTRSLPGTKEGQIPKEPKSGPDQAPVDEEAPTEIIHEDPDT